MLSNQVSTRRQDPVAAMRAFIQGGGFAPGDRIPPERDLMRDLGISRSTLRKALDVLEREGAIWRHVGKGTFVSAPSAPDRIGAADDAALLQQLTPVRMMRARLCIEGAIAREAALNASRESVTRIQAARLKAETATSWAAYEAQDDRFHRAVAEATDNALLVSLFDQLNRVRRAVGWANLSRAMAAPSENHASFAEHRRIVEAIEARDPGAAYEAMRAHVGSVSARLFGEP